MGTSATSPVSVRKLRRTPTMKRKSPAAPSSSFPLDTPPDFPWLCSFAFISVSRCARSVRRPVAPVRVHRLDPVPVAGLHHAPLHLEGGGQRPRLDGKLLGDQRHLLGELAARELAQAPQRVALQELLHPRVADQ